MRQKHNRQLKRVNECNEMKKKLTFFKESIKLWFLKQKYLALLLFELQTKFKIAPFLKTVNRQLKAGPWTHVKIFNFTFSRKKYMT